MNEEIVSYVAGGKFADERGTVSFFNDFKMDAVKRFYIIEPINTDTIRAWQGHRHEKKWFYVTTGSFRVAIIKPNDWQNPSRDLKPMVFGLSSLESMLLFVPAGHVTGFRALEKGSKLIVFSDKTLDESKDDDFRFDVKMWADVWE